MEEIYKLKLQSSLIECEKHCLRIKRVYLFLKQIFPVENSDSLNDEWVEHCDQFIYRFTKLQDALGLRFIPSLYCLLEGHTEAKPFLDILNRLEKLGIIESVERWQYFRVLRNSFDHEYPEREQESLVALNELFRCWPEFLLMYKRLEKVAFERV